MLINLEEFAKDFSQDVLNEADAGGKLLEDVFFEKFCVTLTDTGELDTADRADYKGPPRSGIRVDGYGGDPLECSGTLSLIISDFNQLGEVGRLTKTDMEAMFRRLYKFLEKSLDSRWRNALEESSRGFHLASLVAERWQMVTRVRMFLISNRELSDRVDGREADEIDGRTVTYSVWDIGRLYRFEISGREREDMEIDLEKDFGGAVALLPAHLPDGEYEAYLSALPGEMLASIYERWGTRLLEQNVRVFLQARGNVNKGIRNTLENNSGMFFAYNNGITATAEEIKTEKRGEQLVLTGFRNFQIVNGGQTTASIHVAMRNKIDLSKVFVQMKLSIVAPERAEEVVPKISEYANTQNRVTAADFFANHPFHVRMEGFSRRLYAPSPDGAFRETRWFYERARGQYNDERAKLTEAGRKKFDLEHPRSQLFTKTDLAKFRNVWEMKPDKVSLGAQKNFAHFAGQIGREWDRGDTAFNEGFFKETIAKAIIFKRMEKIVSSESWYQGGYRANIVAYAIAKMAYDVAEMKQAVDFHAIWNRQSISSAMEQALALVAKKMQDILLNTPSGMSHVGEWSKKSGCWDKAKVVKIKWPQKFLSELVSNEEKKSRAKADKKDQKVLNGIEAQTVVLQAGPEFWQSALKWGKSKKMLSERDTGILIAASRASTKIPNDKQSETALKILKRLQQEGFNEELPTS